VRQIQQMLSPNDSYMSRVSCVSDNVSCQYVEGGVGSVYDSLTFTSRQVDATKNL
jgi:hypothetical protein